MNATKTYLVTGAASGMGAGLAQRLVSDGHNVVACDIAEDRIDTGGWPSDRAIVCHVDVRDPDDWAGAVKTAVGRYGGLDVCCNIAGYLRVTTIEDMSFADVDRHIDVNTKGVIYGTYTAARQMLQQGHGHIVTIASLAALTPAPGLPLYAASKFGARGFSLTTGLELRKKGIALTVVYPDAVATPMLDVQMDRPEAALTFSGTRALTVGDVVDELVGHVFVKRPLETAIPRSRGALAKLAGAFPRLGEVMEPRLARVGLRNQARMRRGR